MKKYRCFVVDDEPLAVDVIVNHLERLQNFEVVGAYTEPLDAFTALKKEQVDLLFLDIEMPDFNGMDFIKAMKQKPEIIITTAFREFAVEGFELNILDYLVKPIALERFMKSIDKFMDKKAEKKLKKGFQKEFIMVRADRKFLKIPLNSILYVEGLKDYVKIVTTDKKILTKQSIGNFEKELDSNHFFRIHKSFIVSVEKITAYTKHDIELGEIELPIGRMYREAFVELMNTKR